MLRRSLILYNLYSLLFRVLRFCDCDVTTVTGQFWYFGKVCNQITVSHLHATIEQHVVLNPFSCWKPFASNDGLSLVNIKKERNLLQENLHNILPKG